MNQFGQDNTNDLQKAIDELNGATPVEGGEQDIKDQMGVPPVPPVEGVGVPPMPTEEPATAPTDFTVPEMPALGAEPVPAPAVEAATAAEIPAPEVTPEVAPEVPAVEAPVVETPVVEAPAAPEVAETPEVQIPAPEITTTETAPVSGDLAEIKKKALHELAPIIDEVDGISAENKFDILADVMDEDKAFAGKALDAAKGITDEKTRAAKLLELVQKIDQQ